jgi:hypothetical protein
MQAKLAWVGLFTYGLFPYLQGQLVLFLNPNAKQTKKTSE